MPITVKRPVVRKKLSDTVEEELELMIRRGDIPEGDALPAERELMTAFGVGRPSIRDALAALSRKGLVKISSGERTRVTRPSAENIISELSGMSKDFLAQPGGLKYFDQMRQFFESSLVRHAAEFATDEQIAKLDTALELNRLAIGNTERFKRTDINFHREIADIPGNPIFLSIHQALACASSIVEKSGAAHTNASSICLPRTVIRRTAPDCSSLHVFKVASVSS